MPGGRRVNARKAERIRRKRRRALRPHVISSGARPPRRPGDGAVASANFLLLASSRARMHQGCFGAAPKAAREAHALPAVKPCTRSSHVSADRSRPCRSYRQRKGMIRSVVAGGTGELSELAEVDRS